MYGSGWSGRTTAGTTETKTKAAVLASQAAICVEQCMKQPNHEKKLKELEEVSSWQRAEVIEKGGWDKMPGQAKAGYAVARACADGPELLYQEMRLVRALELCHHRDERRSLPLRCSFFRSASRRRRARRRSR